MRHVLVVAQALVVLVLQALVVLALQAQVAAPVLQVALVRQAVLVHLQVLVVQAVSVSSSVSGTKMRHVLCVLTKPVVGVGKTVRAVLVARRVKASLVAVA